MKKINQLFTVLLLPVDAVMVLAAFVVAYWARADAIAFPVIYIWPFDQYIVFALQILAVWLVAFAFAGLYKQQRRYFFEFGQIVTGASLGAMAVVLWVFIFRSDFFSRLIVFYIWALAILFVSIGRALLGLIKTNLYIFGHKGTALILAGNQLDIINTMYDQVSKDKSLGYRLIGVISDKQLENENLKKLGSFEELEQILKNKTPDELILTDPDFKNEDLFQVMRTCQENDIQFKAVPAYAQVGIRTLRFDAFAGIPIIDFIGTPLDSWGIIAKRIVDVVLSSVAIVILSPLMLLISILIKAGSKGPVIYRNTRIGNKGKFPTLKFRTMFTDYCTGPGYGGSRAEEYESKLIETNNIKKGSAVYKIANDPRITPIGNFLRKTSLDELPQFFNVFVGNMSLVGPRPHQPREVSNYTKEQRKLLMIKPGITGLAQISGRSDLSFDEEARLDISYLENWTIWLDFIIILRTFSTVIWGKGSY